MWFCYKCKTENTEDVCIFCGAKKTENMSPEQMNGNMPTKQTRRKIRNVCIAAAGIILIGIGCLTTVCMLQRGQADSECVETTIPLVTFPSQKAEIRYPTNDEIMEMFVAADDVYTSWIFGQFYVDWNTATDETDSMTAYCRVTDENIQNTDELYEMLHKHFSKSLIEQYYTERIMPIMREDGLYLMSHDGLGGVACELVGCTQERITDTLIKVTFEIDPMDERGDTATFYLVWEDGKWLFDNGEIKNTYELSFYSINS